MGWIICDRNQWNCLEVLNGWIVLQSYPGWFCRLNLQENHGKSYVFSVVTVTILIINAKWPIYRFVIIGISQVLHGFSFHFKSCFPVAVPLNPLRRQLAAGCSFPHSQGFPRRGSHWWEGFGLQGAPKSPKIFDCSPFGRKLKKHDGWSSKWQGIQRAEQGLDLPTSRYLSFK